MLGELGCGVIQSVESCLKTVTGERAPIRGKIDLEIGIGNQTFIHETWIADITDECLLGLDFLMLHGCQVDVKDGVLCLGREEIPLSKPSAGALEQHCYRAVVARPVSLPPHSEVIVPARIEGLSGGERWGILESAVTTSQDATPVLVGRTLVDLQRQEVPVRVMNLTHEPRRLRKGAALAQCEELMSICQPDVGGASCQKTLPTHLVALHEQGTADLSESESQQVRGLLVEFADVFSEGPMDLGRTDLVKHHIRTDGANPIRQRPRRLPYVWREEARKAVEEMKKQNVIEPSASPWSSPVVLVRKKDGSVRFCVDYRKLNEVTHKDSYPLPRIDDALESLSGSEWFTYS